MYFYIQMYMYKHNDEQTLIHTKVTLGEHETKSQHLCQITTCTTHVYTSKIFWEQKYSSIVVVFGVTPHLNNFLLCHCQQILHFINIVIALSKVFYVMSVYM